MASSDSSGFPQRSPAAYALPAVADLIAIIVFVIIGRRNHDEAESLTGLLGTLWPFVVGAIVGWIAAGAAVRWRGFAPARVVPAGVTVWICTIVIGMALRYVTGQGTAGSFIVVATIATGVLLLGWRAIAAVVVSRRRAA